jgi:hypothetical protein
VTLATDIAMMKVWPEQLAQLGTDWIGRANRGFFVLDLIYLGALKRTVSLVSGFDAMVERRNMVCARAMLRMNLDTLSRTRAYTYVDDAEAVTRAVLAGTRLDTLKAADGQLLRDAYLIQRLTAEAAWIDGVYRSTSGYVHFSEKQVFDAVQSVDARGIGSFTLVISDEDEKYPESSWIEVVACFNRLTHLTTETLRNYFEQSAE